MPRYDAPARRETADPRPGPEALVCEEEPQELGEALRHALRRLAVLDEVMEAINHPDLTPREQAALACSTMPQHRVAEAFDVSEETIRRWRTTAKRKAGIVD